MQLGKNTSLVAELSQESTIARPLPGAGEGGAPGRKGRPAAGAVGAASASQMPPACADHPRPS